MNTPATMTELLPEDPFQIPDNPKGIPLNIRARLAFELRKTGVSYEVIAEKLGYANANSCESAIRSRIKGMYKPDDVDEVVNMELARLDALQLVAWRRAKDGDLSAIDRILKIMERRAQYLGLDKQTPKGGDVTVTNNAIFIGGTEEEYIEQLKQAREQMKALSRFGGK